MALKPVDNLRGFAYQRPPLVAFLVCLLLFAIALISLGLYLQGHEVPKYETEDWNEFFQEFANQRFCIPLNDSSIYQPPSSPPLFSAGASTTQEPGVDEFDVSDIVGPKNVSVAVNLNFIFPGEDVVGDSSGLLSLSSSLPAEQLNLEKSFGNVALTFDLQQSIQHMQCKGQTCEVPKVSACLTIAVPPNALPHVGQNIHPQPCYKNVSHTLNGVWMNHKPLNQPEGQEFCSAGIKVGTEFTFDPSLTIFLSEEEKSIINLHLMYTSYFLFIMLITSVFYALVKGPPFKQRSSHENGIHKKPLTLA